MNKVDKLYSLNNSYFKNRKDHYPDTVLEIVKYWKEYAELPFSYSGNNWIYDAMCERQKKKGILGSQYLTPDSIAEQIVELADNFNPEGMNVLDACCGTGQLSKQLALHGFNVTGYDSDAEMVHICNILYPDSKFFQMDYRFDENPVRWELIVANPPHEQQYLPKFLDWLSMALKADGKAILILPTDYLQKSKPAELVKILKCFECSYRETLSGKFLYTNSVNEIYILELSEAYKELMNLQGTKTDKNNQETEISILKTNIMETSEKDKVHLVPLLNIKPNPDNPRKKIKEEEIKELAQSIKKSGLLQPVTLRQKDGYFEIVIGERRCMACNINGEASIAAYIKDLSDIEVMEIALAENLLRENLTAMEESNAFQRLLLTGKYTVEDLVKTFGKTESYIRSRLRLQNLTDDFKALLDNDIITLGVGLEISKYDEKTQKSIFNEHFMNEDNTNWKDLGTKELAGRIERAYTTELSKYKFDKKECNSCSFNTGTYSLFGGADNGRCTNTECLNKKRTDFTMSFCKVIADKYENVDVCITPYDKLEEVMTEKLEEQGISLITTIANDYPVAPPVPIREEYKSEQDYSKAMEDHRIEVMTYNHELGEIEDKIENGEFKKVIYIGDNNPKLAYIPVKTDSGKDPLKALEEEDAANKRNATNGVIKDLSQLLLTCGLPPSGFSAFEEQMLVFFMLDSLNVKHYSLFGINLANLKSLPDDIKYKISKSVTAEQKAIIQRDFLIRYITKSVDTNSKSLLLIEFTRQHFPQESADISRKYTDAYNTKYQKIKKLKEALVEKVEG